MFFANRLVFGCFSVFLRLKKISRPHKKEPSAFIESSYSWVNPLSANQHQPKGLAATLFFANRLVFGCFSVFLRLKKISRPHKKEPSAFIESSYSWVNPLSANQHQPKGLAATLFFANRLVFGCFSVFLRLKKISRPHKKEPSAFIESSYSWVNPLSANQHQPKGLAATLFFANRLVFGCFSVFLRLKKISRPHKKEPSAFIESSYSWVNPLSANQHQPKGLAATLFFANRLVFGCFSVFLRLKKISRPHKKEPSAFIESSYSWVNPLSANQHQPKGLAATLFFANRLVFGCFSVFLRLKKISRPHKKEPSAFIESSYSWVNPLSANQHQPKGLAATLFFANRLVFGCFSVFLRLKKISRPHKKEPSAFIESSYSWVNPLSANQHQPKGLAATLFFANRLVFGCFSVFLRLKKISRPHKKEPSAFIESSYSWVNPLSANQHQPKGLAATLFFANRLVFGCFSVFLRLKKISRPHKKEPSAFIESSYSWVNPLSANQHQPKGLAATLFFANRLVFGCFSVFLRLKKISRPHKKEPSAFIESSYSWVNPLSANQHQPKGLAATLFFANRLVFGCFSVFLRLKKISRPHKKEPSAFIESSYSWVNPLSANQHQPKGLAATLFFANRLVFGCFSVFLRLKKISRPHKKEPSAFIESSYSWVNPLSANQHQPKGLAATLFFANRLVFGCFSVFLRLKKISRPHKKEPSAFIESSYSWVNPLSANQHQPKGLAATLFFANRLVFGCFSVFLRLKKISRPHKKEPSAFIESSYSWVNPLSANQHQPKGLAATLFFANRLVFGCFSVFLRLKKISRPHKKEPSAFIESSYSWVNPLSANQHQPKGLAATLFFANRLVFGCFSVFLRLKKISRPHKKEPSAFIESSYSWVNPLSANQHQPKGLAATLFFANRLVFGCFSVFLRLKKISRPHKKEPSAFIESSYPWANPLSANQHQPKGLAATPNKHPRRSPRYGSKYFLS